MSHPIHNVGAGSPLRQAQFYQVPDDQATAKARRLELYQYSTFESSERPVSKVTLLDGTSIVIPQRDAAQEASLESFYRRFPAEKREQLKRAAGEMAETYHNAVIAIPPERFPQPGATGSLYDLMPGAHQAELQQAVSRMQDAYGHAVDASTAGDLHHLGVPDPATMDHQQMMYALTTGTTDQRDVANNLMLAGMGPLHDQLLGFSGQVQSNLDARKDLQADLLNIRDTLAEWPAGAETQSFAWTERTQTGEVIEHVEDLTRAEAEQLVGELEAQLATMDTTTLTDQLHLQEMIQGCMQATTTFSQILDVQHKTQSAMIANLKG